MYVRCKLCMYVCVYVCVCVCVCVCVFAHIPKRLLICAGGAEGYPELGEQLVRVLHHAAPELGLRQHVAPRFQVSLSSVLYRLHAEINVQPKPEGR